MFIKHTRKHSLSETWQNLHSPFARLIPCNFVFFCAIVFLHCKLNFDMPSLIVRSACPPFFVLILSATRPSNCYAAIATHLPLSLSFPLLPCLLLPYQRNAFGSFGAAIATSIFIFLIFLKFPLHIFM